jgi:hypothetical protein
MTPGSESCLLCVGTLSEAAARWNGPFCALKERYCADPTYDEGQVLAELARMVTPEQRRELADAMVRRGLGTR